MPIRARLTRRIVHLSASAMLLVALIGCGGSDSATPQPPGSISSCLYGLYPVPLVIQWSGAIPADAGELKAYTDKCGQAVELTNGSAEVWTIATSTGVEDIDQEPSQGEAQEAFLSVGTLIQIGTRMVLPGSTVIVHDSPANVSWTADDALTMSWRIHRRLFDDVKEKATDLVVDLITEGSPFRQALASCVKTAFNFVKLTDTRGEQGSTKTLLDAIGVGKGAGECADDWEAAAAEDHEFPSWEADVPASFDEVFVREGDVEFEFLAEIENIVAHVHE